MNTYKVTITCKGKPVREYVFENVHASDKRQAAEITKRNVIPQHVIKAIEIEEVR